MERREIELEVKTGKSEKDLKDVVDILDKISDKLDDVDKGGDAVEGVGKGASKGTKGLKAMFKQLTSIGTLFKASGVFFIASKIFEGLAEAFRNNQTYLDAFAVAGNMATQVITDFTNFVFNNFGKVQEFFKSVFEDPGQSVRDLGNAIKQGFIDRIEQAKEVLGLLANAAVSFFKGDFKGAVDSLKEAGKESVDVITGQDDTLQKVKDTISEVTTAVVDYTSKTYKQAKAVVQLNKDAERSQAINQGLIEQYDLLAEEQRQLRDDERNGIEARIEANNKLKTVLLEQQELMTTNAEKVRDAAKARFELSGLEEDRLTYIQAENELMAVNARVTGLMAEQKSNDLSLDKERIEIGNQLALIGAGEFERQRAENDAKLEEQLRFIDQEVTNEDQRNALIEKARLEHKVAMIDVAEQERQEQIGKTQEFFGGLQSIAQAFGKESKALAIAGIVTEQVGAISKIISNTAIANAKSIAATPLTAGMPFVGINNVMAGVSIAGSVAGAAKAISDLKSNKKSPSRISAPTGGGRGQASAPTQSAPSFNVVGSSETSQLAETISGQQQKPIKAFVVSNDVTTAQSLERNIVNNASIG